MPFAKDSEKILKNDFMKRLKNTTYICIRGCFNGGRKILEGGPTFLSVYKQKFRSVWLSVEKEFKIKRLPAEKPAAIFVWFVPSVRFFLAKAVYIVLGSSHVWIFLPVT